MTITIKTARSTFVKAMGDGVVAAQALKVMIDDMLDNELDGRILAGALNDITVETKQDLQGYKDTKAIVGMIFTNLKFKLDDDENIRLGTKNAVFNQEAYDRFADGVDNRKLGIRGTLVDAVKGVEKTKKEFDQNKWVTNLVNKAMKEGISEAAMVAYVQAAYKAAVTK